MKMEESGGGGGGQVYYRDANYKGKRVFPCQCVRLCGQHHCVSALGALFFGFLAYAPITLPPPPLLEV